ncbi:MAG: hypothetical protein FJY76_00715 [Candidatus Aenigmarchaeota archaeon]|nr:hypothetical protein [Candidatus Aenigmarchaeota archaeon]
MGGAMNYSKGRQAMRRMAEGKAKAFSQNIIVEHGKGRYPKCLNDPPYPFCPKPKQSPQDTKNVPDECRSCQEYLKSAFHEESSREERVKRFMESGMPLRIEG